MNKKYIQKKRSMISRKCKKYIYTAMLIIVFLLSVVYMCRAVKSATRNLNENYEAAKAYVDTLRAETKNSSKEFLLAQNEISREPLESRRDSLWEELIVNMQTEYNHRLDNVLADIRQEYNNQLNNLNIWVAVWLGVLAIISVVLPIVISYIVKSDYEKKVDDCNRKIEEVCESFEKRDNSLQISAIIGCIKNINELGTKFFIPERKVFLYDLLFLLHEKNGKLIMSIKSMQPLPKIDRDLMIYLFHFQAFAKVVKPLYTYPSSLIMVEEIENIIQKLINDIAYITEEETMENMERLQTALKDLLLVTRRGINKRQPIRSF